MNKSVDNRSEIESARYDYMKVRFRRALGEAVASSSVKEAKKKISGLVKMTGSKKKVK